MINNSKFLKSSKTIALEKGETNSITLLKRIKNILGVGPYLLLLFFFFEGLTIVIRRWIYFPISLTFDMQIILSMPCISACLLGMIWFNRSLNLIKVNFLNEKNKLITHGPFNYVRHPLYSTLLLTIPPLLIIWFSDFLFFIPWLVILILSHYLVSLEERGLVKIFGEDYEKYRRYVPPLLPYKGAGGRHLHKHCNESSLGILNRKCK
jgi:protein-S-isoprenylcysteine O-methyltransferase Ste14